MTEAIFQPFTDRLSRDIRNTLSESLLEVIRLQTLAPAQAVADTFLNEEPAAAYKNYIDERLKKYQQALTIIGKQVDDPCLIALILWDKQLFFEVHEVLEPVWLKAEGEEKLFFQAMIRAAAVYIKLEFGYADPAARIAAKALPVLERNRKRLRRYTDPELLITALRQLHSQPPLLLGK
ncbi:MAG: DUF309 domain-containing protein [Desulfocapsaceae bacterium]|nr:DUF309 domain-containing protein [Desulfocapsaceae bacterium]